MTNNYYRTNWQNYSSRYVIALGEKNTADLVLINYGTLNDLWEGYRLYKNSSKKVTLLVRDCGRLYLYNHGKPGARW